MVRRANAVWIFTVIGVLVLTGAMLGTVRAQEKAAVPKAPNKIALGENDVKQLLLLMDTDKNGKISKQEYMTFMEAEFDRLDTDKSGELDPKELAQSSLRVSRPVPLGK
jgi:Ca2+-binding EF-hand superfamily protein